MFASRLRQELWLVATHLLGRWTGRKARPIPHPEGHENSYSPVALAISTLTPGPMVELSEIFFI